MTSNFQLMAIYENFIKFSLSRFGIARTKGDGQLLDLVFILG